MLKFALASLALLGPAFLSPAHSLFPDGMTGYERTIDCAAHATIASMMIEQLNDPRIDPTQAKKWAGDSDNWLAVAARSGESPSGDPGLDLLRRVEVVADRYSQLGSDNKILKAIIRVLQSCKDNPPH